jgi:signal transduction histidine kinase
MENIDTKALIEENKKLKEQVKSMNEQLLFADKMVVLGENMSGIVHEINTPLGAIKSSSHFVDDNFFVNLRDFFEALSVLEQKDRDFIFSTFEKTVDNERVLSTREERKIKKEIVAKLDEIEIDNSREFSSILLKIGIFEINDKIKSILLHDDSLKILSSLEEIVVLYSNIKNISVASKSIISVVKALKSYSRFDENSSLSTVKISDIVETVLIIFNNQMKHGVKLVKEYESNKVVKCYQSRLIQVFTNLISNALFAMDSSGELHVNISSYKNYEVVSIKDSGCGIPQDIQNKIFNKFFTTKPVGIGSGLGLDIVKKIVDEHNGKIEFTSTGNGTEFRVYIDTQCFDKE